MAANGTDIKTFGQRNMHLHVADKHFTWPFILANAPVALLGADFLRAHNLMVDLVHKRLVQADSFTSVPLRP